MIETFMNMESSILLFIQNNWHGTMLSPIMVLITRLGDKGMIWIVISLILLVPKKTRKIGLISLAALAGSLIFNNMLLKNLVGRERPFTVIEGLLPLVTEGGYSFPSGHTASSFASAFVLFRHLPRKVGIPCLVLAGMIGFSRIFVGVHYPSDVLFGVLTGWIISILLDPLFTWKAKRG